MSTRTISLALVLTCSAFCAAPSWGREGNGEGADDSLKHIGALVAAYLIWHFIFEKKHPEASEAELTQTTAAGSVADEFPGLGSPGRSAFASTVVSEQTRRLEPALRRPAPMDPAQLGVPRGCSSCVCA